MKAYYAIILALLTLFCSTDTASHASIPPSISRSTTAHKPLARPLIAKASCYYRVKKGQRKYATGSYRGDIRLNGTGITRSGKLVKVGHLAADLRKGKHHLGERYHVFIDGKDHGIWTIEDKGDAIKGYNRFDFCAGAGDKGRARATAWGMGEGHTVEMYRL